MFEFVLNYLDEWLQTQDELHLTETVKNIIWLKYVVLDQFSFILDHKGGGN